MSKYTITNAVQTLDDQGNPKLDQYQNYSYKVFVTDEDGGIHNFFYNTKKADVQKGEVLEGELQQATSKTGNAYTKFVKAQAGGGFAPRQTGGYEKPDNHRSFALSYAKDVVVARITAKEKVEKPISEIIKYAAVLVDWLDKKVPPTTPFVDPVKTAVDVFKDQVGQPDYSKDDPFGDAVDYAGEEA